MDTIDRRDAPAQQARFCPSCGQPAAEAAFCPACGHNMGFSADRTIADPALTDAGASRGRRSSLVAVLGACALLGIAAIVVAVLVITSGSSSKASGAGVTATYRQQVGRALSPLVAANGRLSSTLAALDGSAGSSRTAVRDAAAAQATLNTANGAIGTLSAPSSQQALAGQVKQALNAENGYLQAVTSTLQTPSGPDTGQLQTLATGAQSALVALGSALPNAGASISAASSLAGWAHAEAARARRKAAGGAPASTAVTTAPAAATSGVAADSGAGGASATSTVSCGNGLFAGPHTSCPFAQNVQQAWANAPGESNVVTAYSPVTGESYTEQCGPNDSGQIECVGVGNPSSVMWSN